MHAQRPRRRRSLSDISLVVVQATEKLRKFSFLTKLVKKQRKWSGALERPVETPLVLRRHAQLYVFFAELVSGVPPRGYLLGLFDVHRSPSTTTS